MSPPVSTSLRNRKIWDWEGGRFQVSKSKASLLCPYHSIFLLISWNEAGIPPAAPAVFLDGSCSSSLFHIFSILADFFPGFSQYFVLHPNLLLKQFPNSSRFHLFLGLCCFKVTRIHSAAVLVIYSLRGLLEQRI